MPIDANLGRDSSVVSFEIGNGSIEVSFNYSSKYLYSEQSADAGSIVRMHNLAAAGEGLSS